MRIILTLLLLAEFVLCQAQKPDWIRNAEMAQGSYASVEGKRIAVHPDGSVFVLGHYSGESTVGGQPLVPRDKTLQDAFLAKFDSDGNLIWLKQLFESSEWYSNRVIDIKVDHAGDLVFTGACLWPTRVLGSQAGQGVFLAKMDKDANLKWVNFESGVSLQNSDASRRGNRIAFDPQQNILLFTDQIFTISFGNEVGGLAVIKYKPDGTKVSNTFLTRNPSYYHPAMNDFAVDREGNLIISASYEFDIAFVGGPSFRNNTPSPRINPRQFFVAKFSAEGQFLWTIHTDLGGSCLATAHTVDRNGNIYFGATMHAGAILYAGTNRYTSDGTPFLAQLTPDGNLKWLNRITNSSVQDMVEAPDGFMYATGYSYGTLQYQSYVHSILPGTSKAFVLKINTAGYVYGLMHSDEYDNPATTMRGSHAYGFQSIVDNTGNIYTMGDFWDGVKWGCVPALTSEYSFYLVKHTPVASPVRSIAGPVGPVCDGTSLTLTTDLVSNAVRYKWFIPGEGDPGNGAVLKNSIDLVARAEHDKQPVIVSITDACDEYFAEPFILNVPAPPSPPQMIGSKDRVCAGTSEPYAVAEADNVDSYHWTLSSGITAHDVDASTATLIFGENFAGGSVKVTASNFCGSSQMEFYIGVNDAPAAPVLDGSIALCPGFTQIRKYIAPVANAISYHWELPPFVVHDPLFPQNTNTLYANVLSEFQSGEIKVKAVGICEPSDVSRALLVKRVSGPGSAQPLQGPFEICSSNDEVIRYSIPAISQAKQYVWEVPDFFTEAGTIITTVPYLDLRARVAGLGLLRVYGKNECREEGEGTALSIESYEELPEPLLTAGECDRDLTVSNATEFHWYFNGQLAPHLIGDHLLLYDSGSYYVEASNFCGVRQSNTVRAYPAIPESIQLPNVITPNGDGSNDYFTIDPSLKDSYIEIMNRWGTPVFSSQDYANNWSAEGLASGSYIYFVVNRCITRPYKGIIHVMK